MIDPYNDNQKRNYERWWQVKLPYVQKYLNAMKLSVNELELSPKANMMLRFNGLSSLARIITLDEKSLEELELSNSDIAKEIIKKRHYYMKEIRDELVNYVESSERKNNAVSENDFDASDDILADESRKSDFYNYLTSHDIAIEQLELGNRSYNALKRAHVNYLSEALVLYPDGFSKLKNIGVKTVNEICQIILEKAHQFFANEGSLSWDTTSENNSVEDSPQSFDSTVDIMSLLRNPDYRVKIYEFFSYKNISVYSFGFSARVKNYLLRTEKNDFLDLLKMYPDELENMSKTGMGEKSKSEVVLAIHSKLEQNYQSIKAYIDGDYNAVYDDVDVCDYIMTKYYEFPPFYGISFAEFKKDLPEMISERRLKKCIGKLLAEEQIEYVDFRCYKKYPSFFDVLDEIIAEDADKKYVILREYYLMRTLEDIAKDYKLTRERIRQLQEKALKGVNDYLMRKYNTGLFDEDYYKYLYENYEVPKDTWIDLLNVSEKVYGYLKRRYHSGEKPFEESADDPEISVSLKFKLIDVINSRRIEVDGRFFIAKRGDIEDFIVWKYCQNDTSFEDFCDIYNRILKENSVDPASDMYLTGEVARSRTNRLAESRKLLWKNGRKFRYYDIDGKDYQELFDTIGIYSYFNTGISTLYWFNNFPEIMEKYDIRDQYELHNLLKKIVPRQTPNNIVFDRMPGITFGRFDRDQMVFEVMSRNQPISSEDLASILYEEYGYDKGTSQGSMFKGIRKYYHDGIFSLEFKPIPDNRKEQFLSELKEELYFGSELLDIYYRLFPWADKEEISPRSMQMIGFVAYQKYYLKNTWSSATEYFKHILTKDDLFDCSPYNQRYAYITLYTEILRELRGSFDLFLLKDGTALSINRLNSINIYKQDIQDYCDSVDKFVTDSSFFTLQTLRNAGFESSLDDLGFDDSFCEGILQYGSGFNCTHCEGVAVFSKGIGTKNFTKKDFLLAVVSEYDSITLDDLMNVLAERYGIVFPERYKLVNLLSDTEIYYDSIMDSFYRNRENYYDELG